MSQTYPGGRPADGGTDAEGRHEGSATAYLCGVHSTNDQGNTSREFEVPVPNEELKDMVEEGENTSAISNGEVSECVVATSPIGEAWSVSRAAWGVCAKY